MLGSKGGILVVGLAVAASAAGLVAMDPFGDEEPSTFEVPELEPGTHATYDASGNYTNALDDPLVGDRDDISPDQPLFVNATPMQVPDASGQPTDALVVTVAQPGDPMVHTAQAHGTPFAEVDIEAIHDGGFGHEPFENLTRVDYRVGPDASDPQLSVHPGLGFADTALFSGLTIPEDGTTVANASRLGHALVESLPAVQDWQVDGVDGDDGFEVQITSDDGSLQGVYVFDGECPFPAQVRIPAYPTGIGFEATRTSCETSEPEPIGGEGWPKPSTSTIERSFPGEGDALPLHYREAFEFFLSQEETRTWTDVNPDWVLYCANLVERASSHPLYSNWTWRFELEGDSGNHTGWVTRTEATQELTGPWVRDRSPPHLDTRCRQMDDELRGATFANLDDSVEVLDAIVEPSLDGDEVRLGEVRLGPSGPWFGLDRCGPYLESQGGGLCGERVPWIWLTRQGRVMEADLEPAWFADPLAPIAGP